MTNKLTLSYTDGFDENDVVDCKYLHTKTNVVKIINENIPGTADVHGAIHHNQVVDDVKKRQCSKEEDHFKVQGFNIKKSQMF